MARSRRMQGFRKRGKIWHIWSDPLTGKSMSTGCRDESAALQWRDERERLASSPAHVAAEKEKLGTWLSRFLEAKQAAARNGTLAVPTVSYWEGKIGHLQRLLGEETSIAAITPELIDDYVSRRRSEPAHGTGLVKDCTITRELRGLLGALKMAKRAGRCPLELETLVPEDLGTTGTPRQRALELDEVSKLMAAMPDQQWAAFVAVCVALGYRRSEALKLLPSDIEWQSVDDVSPDGSTVKVERGFVLIHGTKTKASNRVVPVLSCYAPLLKAATAFLPIGALGNWDRTFKDACARAGIPHCSPNDLRRTHATRLGERGMSNQQIADLLGHKTIAMAQNVYNQSQAARLAPVAERVLSNAAPMAFDLSALQNPASEKTPDPKGGAPQRIRTFDPRIRRPIADSQNSGKSANTSAPACMGVHESAPAGSRIQTKSRQCPAAGQPMATGQLVPLVSTSGAIAGWVPVTLEDVDLDLAPRPVRVVLTGRRHGKTELQRARKDSVVHALLLARRCPGLEVVP